MSSSKYIQQLFPFLILHYLAENIALKGINSCCWFETDLKVVLFSWIDGDTAIRNDLNKLLLKLLDLVVHIESYLYFFLGVI